MAVPQEVAPRTRASARHQPQGARFHLWEGFRWRGLGFGVWGLGFGVWGLGFRV